MLGRSGVLPESNDTMKRKKTGVLEQTEQILTFESGTFLVEELLRSHTRTVQNWRIILKNAHRLYAVAGNGWRFGLDL